MNQELDELEEFNDLLGQRAIQQAEWIKKELAAKEACDRPPVPQDRHETFKERIRREASQCYALPKRMIYD